MIIKINKENTTLTQILPTLNLLNVGVYYEADPWIGTLVFEQKKMLADTKLQFVSINIRDTRATINKSHSVLTLKKSLIDFDSEINCIIHLSLVFKITTPFRVDGRRFKWIYLEL